MWLRWTLAVVLCGAAAVIAACIPLIGFALLGDGVKQMGDASALSDRGRHTVGIVQDTRVEGGGPGSGVDHYIEVRFIAADRSRHDVWMSGERDEGAAVRVLYDRRNPETAVSESVTSLRIHGITHIAGGGLLSIGLLTAYALWGWSKIRPSRSEGKHGIR